MTQPPYSVRDFLAGLELCARHPSRRAMAFCERCELHLCRGCTLPTHVCRPSGGERTAATVRGAALAGALLLLAAATWWGLGREPRPDAVPAVASHQAPVPLPVPLPPPPALTALTADPGPQTRPAIAAPGGPAGQPLGAPASQVRGATPPAALIAAETPRTPTAAAAVAPSPAAAIEIISRPPPATAAHLPAVSLPAATAPVVTVPQRSFDRGPAHRRALVLSFDAGSNIAGAADILDALRDGQVRTTFFVTGDFIREHPDLVRRLAASGHEIANHTDSHPHLTEWESRRRQSTHPEVDRDMLLGELEATDAAFRAVTGRGLTRLWRAPFGEYNAEILGWAAAAGWTHVGWTGSLDTLDWVADPDSSIYRSADEIASRLLAFPDADPQGAHGSIILMHLGSDRADQDRLARVLPDILQGYRARGFEFITASDMLAGS